MCSISGHMYAKYLCNIALCVDPISVSSFNTKYIRRSFPKLCCFYPLNIFYLMALMVENATFGKIYMPTINITQKSTKKNVCRTWIRVLHISKFKFYMGVGNGKTFSSFFIINLKSTFSTHNVKVYSNSTYIVYCSWTKIKVVYTTK